MGIRNRIFKNLKSSLVNNQPIQDASIEHDNKPNKKVEAISIDQETFDGLKSIKRIHCEYFNDVKYIVFEGDGEWYKLLYNQRLYNSLIIKGLDLREQNSEEEELEEVSDKAK